MTLVHERRGRVMGTGFHIVIVGGNEALMARAEARLQELEQRWSRFVPTSEISRLNAQPDQFHLVSADTGLLVQRSVQAWAMTDGAFDPTVLPALVGLGYDRSFETIAGTADLRATAPAPGCAEIDCDPADGEQWLVRLGSGIGFDPGGIGKGLAADIVMGELLAGDAEHRAAEGAMVNVGGDLVCAGTAPTAAGWVVDIVEPAVTAGPIARVALASGAVATSTTAKRTWRGSDGRRHHVVDPASGRCTEGPELVTVIAGEGWRAEALATQALVSGDVEGVDEALAGMIALSPSGDRRTNALFDALAIAARPARQKASAC